MQAASIASRTVAAAVIIEVAFAVIIIVARGDVVMETVSPDLCRMPVVMTGVVQVVMASTMPIVVSSTIVAAV
jgi:hypothetical protein